MLRKRVVLLVPLLALFMFVVTSEQRVEAVTTGTVTWPNGLTCTGTIIEQGDDIDAIINNDRRDIATRFCVRAGTYTVSTQATLRAGDVLEGQAGTAYTIATDRTTIRVPIPVVFLKSSGTDNLLRADGEGIKIFWVDLSGAGGTGPGSGAIAAGSASSDFLVRWSRIHNNASAGITNMKGTVWNSEFFSNSQASASIGFNGSAVKGITEFEAARLYVHDEQGNGIWCDGGCSEDPFRTYGFWVHNSVIVNIGGGGIRYENSPNRALFEYNEVHAAGLSLNRGGVDIRDSQNATVQFNDFGPETINGVTYGANGDRRGIRATDSGRSDRVNLSNISVKGNNLNGDRIITCGGPVLCDNTNINVGTR